MINHFKAVHSVVGVHQFSVTSRLLEDYRGVFAENNSRLLSHDHPVILRAIKPQTQRRESGFTLMELLIVLALVAVISMIAVPIYRNYVQNARITEGLTLASSVQLDAEVFYTLNSRWPSADNAHTELRLADPENYSGNSVESLTLAANKITVVYNDTVVGDGGEGGAKLILTAQVTEGSVIRWACAGENIDPQSLPTECAS